MTMLDPVESFAAGIIAALDPRERKALAADIAKLLRTSQQRRIAAQQNPDGSAFDPRKPQLRHQKGKIRRSMFQKLRTAKYLKAQGTADAAIVSFTGEVERIARVHQFGLRDKVNRRTGLEVTYSARRLLGISEADEADIKNLIVERLANRL